jgi:hypothetical protein
LTVNNNTGFSDSGITGAHNYGNGITLNGASAALTIATTGSTITATSCALIFNGTTACTLTDNRGVSYKSLTLGVNAILTCNGSGSIGLQSTTTVLTLNNGSTLTNNQTINFACQSSQTVFSLGVGYTWNGSGQYNYSGAGSIIITIPAMTYTGTAAFVWGMAANCTINLSGHVVAGGRWTLSQFNAGVTFNTANFNLSCARLTLGSSSVTATASSFNFGSSTIVTTNLVATDAVYTTGGTNIDLSSSVWTCTSDWGFGAHWTVTAGTSIVNFTTNNATITSAGKAFNSVIFNGSGKTYTLADPMFTNTYTLTAGTLALAGYYIFQSGAATTNVWSASGASTWNSASNWSLGHVPTSGEDVLFNSTSVQNCTIDISPSIANLGTQNNYSGNITLSGQTITTSGGMYDFGSGTRDYGNGITINGNSSGFSIGIGLSTITATSCAIVMNGTTAAIINNQKAMTAKTLTLGTGANVSYNSTTILSLSNTTACLILGNNSTFTLNYQIWFIITASTTIFSIGTGVTWVGSAAGIVSAFINGNSLTMTVPSITYTGSGYWYFYGDYSTSKTNNIINLAGNINIATSTFISRIAYGTTSTATFNTNDFSITCGVFEPSNSLASGGSFTVNLGNSVISCTSFRPDIGTSTTTWNLQTAQITCTGTWTWNSFCIVDPGFSTVTINGVANCTNAGKSFYNLIITAGSLINLDALTIASGGTLTNNVGTLAFNPTTSITVLNFAGTYTFNGTGAISVGGTTASLTITFPAFTYTGSGTWTINPAATSTTVFSGAVSNNGSLTLTGGAVTFSSSLTFTGNSTTLSIGSGVGTFTGTACDLTFNGAGSSFVANKSCIFDSLILGSGAVLTISGSSNTVFNSASNTLTLGNNSTLTANAALIFRLSAAGDLHVIGSGCTINGSSNLTFQNQASSGTCTFPEFTYTGSGIILINESSASVPWTIQVTGAVNTGTAGLRIYKASGNAATIDMNNQNITCGAFIIGNDSASAALTINMGSGIYTIASFTGATYNSGTTNFNMSSSQWLCTGSWTFGSNYVVDAGSSLLNLVGVATRSITSAGQPLYDITTAGSTTFNGATTAHNLTTTGGAGFSISTTTLTLSGDLACNGSGPSNLGTGITFTGNSSSCLFSSSFNNFATSSCTLTFNGTTGCTLTDNKGCTFQALVLGAGAVLTHNGSSIATIFNRATGAVLTIGNNATFTANQTVNLFATSAGTVSFWSIGSGCTINGSGAWLISCEYANTVGNISDIAYTGSGKLTIYNRGAYSVGTPVTFNFTGSVNWGTAAIDISGTSAVVVVCTYNFQSYGITCGSFTIGNRIALATTTYNLGSGAFSVVTFTGSTYNVGTCILNFQTSQWTCAGNWTQGSTHTIDTGTTATITYSNAGSHSITPSGKNFPICVAQADTAWH